MEKAAAVASSGIAASFGAIGHRLESVGDQITNVGHKLSIVNGLGAALAAGGAFYVAEEFERAANRLDAIGDLTEEQTKRLRGYAEQLGSFYRFGPTGVMGGMLEELKAGFSPDRLAAVTKPIADFATFAEIDMPQAADLATEALAGFGKMYDATGKILEGSALNKNLLDMVNLFAVLQKVAPGDFKGILTEFVAGAPTAKNLNISPVQLAAFDSVMAQAGIGGDMLRTALMRFVNPTKQSRAALQAAGLNLDDYVTRDVEHGNQVTGVNILKFFSDILGKTANPAVALTEFFGIRGSQIAKLNLPRVLSMISLLQQEVDRGDATAAGQAEKMEKGAVGAENRLFASLQSLIVSMADTGMMDDAAATMNALSGGLRSLAAFNPEVLKFATYTGMLALGLGPMVVALGSLVKTVGALASVVGTIAGVSSGALSTIGGVLLRLAPVLGPIGALLASTKPANEGEKDLYKYDAATKTWGPTAALQSLIQADKALPQPAGGGWAASPGVPFVTGAGMPTARVEGSADLNVNVEVAPSADFISRIESVVRNAINMFGGGAPAFGSTGPTGKSMPEAGPAQQ